MRKTLTILFICLLSFHVKAQTANAGADQTIYLTSGNTATLDGSGSSGTSYLWTEVSTDYSSGATISSQTSKIASVSGLPQGVWYFQIAVTTGGTTVTDLMTVSVDYAPAPYHSTLEAALEIAGIKPTANDRTGNLVTDYNGYPPGGHNTYVGTYGEVWVDRSHAGGAFVDAQSGKYYAILEDGNHWNGNNYDRSEMYFSSHDVDSSKIYCYEWKGYYPQSTSVVLGDFTTFMQLHGTDGFSPVWQFYYSYASGQIEFLETDENNNPSGYANIGAITSFVNSVHTLRVTFKEALNGHGGWIKCEKDGVLMYYRKTGQVGRFSDYGKYGTVYDWNRSIVDPNNYTRDRIFKLASESFRIYSLTDTTSVVNTAPTVSTSGNQSISVNHTSVTSTATAGTGKTITGYSWTDITGGGSATISSPTSQNTSITGISSGTHTFKITVTQNDAQTASATLTITVSAPVAPTIFAGNNQTVKHDTAVVLAATYTTATGYTATFHWVNETGGSGTITSPTTSTTSVTGLADGTYRFGCTLTQSDGQTAYDYVLVTVTPLPTVSAGTNQTITLPTSSVNLTGTATAATGYTMSSYLWTKVSGPGTQTIASSGTLTPTVNGMTAAGTYVFNFAGTQSDGQVGNSTVTITVNTATGPIVSAGANQNITLPTTSIGLTGSATPASGESITSVLWTKLSGAGSQTITNSTTLTPTISGLSAAGTYVFNLKGTQTDGQFNNNSVTITVNAAATPPTVTNSGNQTIIISTASVTSSATPAAGQSITSYLWTKISGNGTITSPTSQNTGLTALSGVSVFRVTVTQTDAQTAYSQLTITVTPPPTVSTSGNQTIGVSSTTVFSTFSTASGQSITAFSWTQISGTTASITSPTAQNTGITGLAVGTSVFRITDTQTDGQTGYSNVTITVTAAPTANAGADQNITLPTTSKTLAGSQTHASGTTATYLWSKLSGAGTQTIANSTSLTPTMNGMAAAGDYFFRLTVTQSDGQVATDDVKITVNTAAAPIISAGSNQSITVTSVSLTGTATWASGYTGTVLWTEEVGTGGTITSPTSLSTTVTGLTTGEYRFRLTGTQGDSQTASDTVHVSVNIPIIAAPTANAGGSQTITLPTAYIALTGSATTASGHTATYFWTKVSGSGTQSITGNTTLTPTISGFSIAGSYVFNLKVTQDDLQVANNTATITVNPAVVPPQSITIIISPIPHINININ